MSRGEIAKHNAYQALISVDQALYNLGGTLWALLACVRSCHSHGQDMGRRKPEQQGMAVGM